MQTIIKFACGCTATAVVYWRGTTPVHKIVNYIPCPYHAEKRMAKEQLLSMCLDLLDDMDPGYKARGAVPEPVEHVVATKPLE